MTDKPWEEWTNTELADEAQIGTRGQGAIAEMIRRLMAVTKQLERSTARLGYIMIVLTAVILALTVVLVVAALT